MFSIDRPKEMNYGSIGSAIGHEITHGFSDSGIEIDKAGNSVDPTYNANFMKPIQCLIDQADKYTVESIGKNVSRW